MRCVLTDRSRRQAGMAASQKDFANLFDGEDDTYNLIWSRGRRQNTDETNSRRRPVRMLWAGRFIVLSQPLD